ncbi:cobalt-precorrin-5B (C(1))-methyltransferase [Metasolibacillus sp.]|uniref:cobalt-precorrin-5B (C(1))-methyltransferase n=1 Tax=Metasolibacillus sp. TaxID=2703680 RepID=UPI0025CD71E6|nr:cobalt-precorrin-5B (C(1))-methyltransferase [Metasolibacillus sp.]MCT6924878.1 cobalt-precorrin-5B (C(1))-methyltransferase [Metasolibacillus sp.]MCT6941146.1 cobalt-precorrin-5B (C(1))-methyltransferase [Metasolibacillus sp.]
MEKPKKDPKEMRHGYTTGACATAATKAALTALLTKEEQETATIHLPVGKDATFTMDVCVFEQESVRCETIKDAGDDPDATHKARIVSTVRLVEKPGIHLDGGVGVGRVTKPGLPVDVGLAAINPVPRKMIIGVVEELIQEFSITCGVEVIISVPDGEEIAKKTLNGRLGIVGGISILGTRGTVVPFSTSAYMASIVQAISVAKSAGCRHVVITTGGRSEKYGMAEYPDLPEEAFIEMGDFVGFTLKHCKRLGIERVSLVGMMGKFSKVAQGVMMVHSKSAPINFEFLAQLAKAAGADEATLAEVLEANTASHVGDMMLERGLHDFFYQMCKCCCYASLDHIRGGLTLSTSLYSMKGELLGRAENIATVNEDDWYRG